jgi:hypothetical protein
MSWNKEAFKKAYNRAQVHKQSAKDNDDEIESQYWGDHYDHWDQWDGPTIKDVAMGRLLTLLVQLRVRYAKESLEQLYW